jgi:GNAT superfamily N-acetyltransferase
VGLIPVAPDQLATVVTTLEMRARPRPRPIPAPWLWFSRLAMEDARLARAIHDPRTQIHAVLDPGGVEVGMLELTHPDPSWCALDYFGLVPEWTGQGHGGWLMALAMQLAWRPGVERVRVNTCTLDHPRALGFYIAQGFTPVSRTIETFADPRVSGLLPRDAAPQIPCLASRRGAA